MAFDQTVRYRAQIDDSDFQAKLSQMRASLDMTMGGMSTFGGGGGMMPMSGMPMSPMMGMAGMMAMGGSGQQFVGTNMGGMADFGTMIRPITYTPPAMAMQPHFGMIKVQQSFGQAMRGMMVNVPGVSGLLSDVPEGITAGEYSAFSTMQAGQRLGQAAMIGTGVAASTAAQLATGSVGFYVGERAMGMISHTAAEGLTRTGLGLEASLGSRALLTAGGLTASMLFTIPVTELADATMDMAADNRRNQNALMAGSGRFITGGPDANPLTGRGFNARGRAGVADFIQSRELEDVRFGMREMSQVLETGMQMDMFSGTGDVESFKKRFSSLVENMKTITSVLHTSVKEGMEMIRGFRDMGVTDPSEVNRMVLGAESMGRASGRTGTEMLAIAQTGAEMFRGTNVRMQAGAELMETNVMNIRSALNAGTLSREVIAQAGGETALAQQMTASTLASFQTGVGRGAMMAAFNPATGTLDPSRLNAEGGVMGMLSRASGIGVRGMLEIQANQSQMISQLSPQQMQMFQIDVLSKHGAMFSAAAGVSGETGFLLAAQQQNVPESVARAMIAMGHAGPDAFRSQQQGAVDGVANQQIAEDFRNQFNVGKQISNAVRRTFVQPLQRGLTAISNSVEQGFENLGVALTGGEMMSRDGSATAVRAGQALRGGSPSGYVFAGEQGIQRMLPGKFAGGALADLFQKEGTEGSVSATDAAEGILERSSYHGANAMVFKSQAAAQEYAKGHHEVVVGLRDVGISGHVLATTQSSIDHLHKEGQKFDLTQKERDAGDLAASKLIGSDGFQQGLAVLQQQGMTDLPAFAGMVLGRKFKTTEVFAGEASREEIATVSAALGRAGPGFAKAAGQLQGLSGQARSSSATDAAAAARADALATDEKTQLSIRLQHTFNYSGDYAGASAIGSFNREELALFGQALGGKEGGAAAIAKLAESHRDIGITGFQKMVSRAKSDGGGGLQAAFAEFSSNAAAAADFAAKSRDPDNLKADPAKAAGQQAGFISQDTKAVMDEMKKYFEQNYQVLTKLHDLLEKKVK